MIHPWWRCSDCKVILDEAKAYWHMQKCEKRLERLASSHPQAD